MQERGFVLLPLLEIAPDAVIPGHGRAADWLAACADQSVVVVASATLQPRPPLYGESVTPPPIPPAAAVNA